MSNRFITIILCMLGAACSLAADGVSVTFCQTPLPTALRAIEQLAGDDITVNFVYRKLEDYSVTTDIIDATPIDAINQAIGFYPIKVSTNGCIITVQPLLDSEYKISGRLVDERGDGVDFATITVLSLPDSAVMASGVSNLRGDFVLPLQYQRDMLLRASRIGYKTVTSRAYTGNMGDVRIETDPHMLKMLTAFADRSAINTVGSVTNINIEGTPYSSIGTLTDLLANLPGFSTLSSAFGIYGSGGIIYYINGREVSEAAQLNMIRSDQVKSISIDKAPGAEYPADAAVVVNISTIKSPDDFINLRVNNATMIRNKLSDVPSIDFKMQLGKFTTALNYSYDCLRQQTDECYERQFGMITDSIRGYVQRNRVFNTSDKGSSLNWSGELQFSPRNRIGLYYYFYSLERDIEGAGNNIIMPDKTNETAVYTGRYAKSSLHSGTISYGHTGRIFTAHFAQDIAYTNPYLSLLTDETLKDQELRHDTHDNEYTLYTTNVRLGLNLGSGTVISGGGRMSYIRSKTNKTYNDNLYSSMIVDGEYYVDNNGNGVWIVGKYNSMKVNEKTVQTYLKLSQRIGNLTIVPGIRYEYVDRHINDISNIKDPAADKDKPARKEYTYDHDYSHLLPSLMLKYVNGKYNTMLNYNRHIVHPAFSMLNSGLVYEDYYTYAKSNPELKPSQIDEVRLSAGYGGFTADMGFRSINNHIAEVEVPVGQGATVYRMPVNLRRYNEYDINVAYASSYGALWYYASANLVIPGWHDVYYSSQKITFNAEINLNYRFNKTFSLYTNLKHYGSCRWMVYDRIDSQLWNLGASASLLNNRLTINVEGTDLLNRNHLYDLSTTYGGVTSTRYASQDSRGVTLRVSYTLFNKQIRTNIKRGNLDAIDRIER